MLIKISKLILQVSGFDTAALHIPWRSVPLFDYLRDPLLLCKEWGIKKLRWDWKLLLEPSKFKWDYTKLPLANPESILLAWLGYFLMIVMMKMAVSKKSAPYELKTISALHNLFLSVWSFLMFVVITAGVIDRWQESGLSAVFCTNSLSYQQGWSIWVLYVYYLSKFYELIDTALLLGRKRPLIFLHWFHHASVILMVWTWLQDRSIFASLGMMFNTLIHTFMYYYYYCAAQNKKVWFKKYLTQAQIFQFTSSFLLSLPHLYYIQSKQCTYGIGAFKFSALINSIFLLLFIQFYLNSYTTSSQKKSMPSSQNQPIKPKKA